MSTSAPAVGPPSSELGATAELLRQVFPGSRIGDITYLHWLYVKSPFGAVIESNLDDDHGRAGHYALVPITLRSADEVMAGALSLNTAVHPRAQGGGVFVRLAQEAVQAAAARGIQTILGVANANSTPGFLRRLDFKLVAPLPVTINLALPARGGGLYESQWAAGSYWPEQAASVLGAPAKGLSRQWDPESLKWRLRSPGRQYVLHRAPGVLAVSALEVRRGVRFGVLLKVFVRDQLPASGLRALNWAVARWHHSPLVLHAGINAQIVPHGMPLPQRLRVSPLNLIRRDLVPAGEPRDEPKISAFEFLDFDAY